MRRLTLLWNACKSLLGSVVLPVALLLLGLQLSTGSAWGGAPIITTYAGGGIGNNSPATKAVLNNPQRVALDSSGNIYIADSNNHLVRKVNASTGIITTVAGTGVAGYGGNGSPATSALLNSPQGVAVDGSGNIYIADYNNHRVRKVTVSTGIITTVAGTGSPGYDGDDVQATTAQLYQPCGVALDDSGNIYIADQYNSRIRKVTVATGIITTVAGDGNATYGGDGGQATAAQISYPTRVVVDSSGNLYIADLYNNRIRKVSAGIITTVAGDGTAAYGGDYGQATSAQLNNPVDLAVDGSGNLYIADSGNVHIRKVTVSTGVITTVAGSGSSSYSGDGGPATAAGMNTSGVAVDGSGNLYIADSGNSRIRKVTAATGIIATVAGGGGSSAGDGGSATGAALYNPTDVARDSSGNIYIADYNNQLIRKVTASTGIITTVAGNGSAGYTGDFGPATQASLNYPVGVAVEGSGNVYIVDTNNCKVRKVDGTTGMITTVAGNGGCGYWGDDGPATDAGLYYPTRATVDGSGNLYIADSYNHRVRKVTASTGIITTVAGDGNATFGGDTGLATSAQLYYPQGVSLDASGNLYIADYYNHRIRKVAAATGVITTVAGDGTAAFGGDSGQATAAQLNAPSGVTLDSGGNLFITDYGNQRIRKVDTSGVISTLAGSGDAGFSGDGGSPLTASLNSPQSAVVDNSGNIFIADAGNNRIREVVVSAIPVTTASPAGGSYNGIQNVTLAANKPVTTYYCLGSGCTPTTSSSVYSGPITISATTTLKFFSVDGAGNTESVKSAAYTITVAAPTTTASPAGGIFSSGQFVTLSCNDGSGPGCGPTYYCLGSGCTPTTVYDGPIPIGSSQIIRYYSKDTANNSEVVKEGIYTIYAGYTGNGPLTGGRGTIITFAGGGVGNNSPATLASLNSPYGIAVDSAGNIYIADTGNNMVRKVNATTGIITTVAGTGSASYSGDGGAATAATLNSPKDVAVDASGNIYIADESNKRIRKVAAATGIITTVAGNGNSTPLVDGSQAVASNITPTNVAVDSSGNIYLTDGSYIRKVTASTGVITTMAGGGSWGELGDNGPATSAWLYSPQGIAVDSSGNLYIADSNNNRIRKVTAATGIITTVAGDGSSNYGGDGGQAPAAQLNYPIGVTVDSAGNLYIADWNNYRVRKVTATGVISTIAGNGSGGFSGDGGPAYNSGMYPDGMAVDAAGNLYISDVYNHRVRKVTAATGIITTIAGSNGGFVGDGGSATGATLSTPYDVARDSSGNIYIADYSNHRIRKVTASTGVITTVAGNGTAGFSGDFGPAAGASLYYPTGIAVDTGGTMYIADNYNCRIRKVDGTTGMISTVAGNGCGYWGDDGPATDAGLYYPSRVIVDSSSNLYITDTNSQRIRKVTAATGIITTVAGDGTPSYGGDNGPATSAQLYQPVGITLDASGNLYIADYYNQRIRKVTAATGIITTIAGTGTPGTYGEGVPASTAYLSYPAGVTLDGSGNLFITDYGNHRVRRIDAATGIILTVAGTGTPGFSGDGGPAVQANLNNPHGVTVDQVGNIFIADSSNNRIREVVVNAIPVTSASPAAGSYNGIQNVTLTANKPVTTYYCLGSGCTLTTSSSVYSGPITISASTTLKFFSVDGTGNTETAKSAAYTITMTAPTTTASPAGGIFSTGQSVTLSCNDGSGPGCGPTYYCLGSGCTPTTIYGGPIFIGGSRILRYYSKDTANNSEAVKEGIYTIYAGYTGNGPLSGGLGNIITFAGGGIGNNSPATSAALNSPYGIAVDSAGNSYIADTGNNMVRKVNATTGIITTVAGTGSASYSGDGGAATAATLNSPKDVAVDAGGNIYIADESNRRIRKVAAATGIITTVAGNGNSVYVDGNQAVASSVTPTNVAVDSSGNIYLTDGSYIRKVTAATGVITTMAGGGSWGELGDNGPATSAWLYNPQGIAVDGSGNLYIADSYNNRIRKVTASTGIITTVAGDGSGNYGGDGGQATVAQLNYPIGVTVDSMGNLYIADWNNYRVRKVTATGVISTIAGNGGGGFSGDGGPAYNSGMYPDGVAVDAAGNLYISDVYNHRVRKVTAATGIITTIAGSNGGFVGDGGAATGATLAAPFDVARDSSGNLYIADRYNNRIRKVTAATGVITTVAGNGNGGFSGDFGPATGASLNNPNGVTMDGNGNLYVSDHYNCRIRKIDGTTGMISTVAGSNGGCGYWGDDGPATDAGLYYPTRVAVDGSGNLYIADWYNHRIRKVTAATGIITTVAGDGTAAYGGDNGPAISAQFNYPYGIAVDNGGNLYIADYYNQRIRKVTAATGVITTIAGTGTPGTYGDGVPASAAYLSYPAGVALDGSGNLYIDDSGNHRVRRIDAATGVILTVAGNSTPGFSGDGGPAIQANLNNPQGVTVDIAGNIFIADTTNNRIREVVVSPIPVTTASPAGGSYNGIQNVTLTANKPVTTYYCLGSGCTLTTSSSVYSGPITISATTTLKFFSVDGAGNTELAKSAAYTITMTAPTTTASPAGGIFSTGQSVTLSCNDGSGPGCGSTYYCLGSGCTPTTVYGGAIAVNSSQIIRYYSKDTANNSEAVKEGIYTIYAGYTGGGPLGAGLGNIITFAGGGVGNNSPATSAALNSPYGIAVDSAGNSYIADTGNNMVRKVNATTGIITTVAGTGSASYSGDGGAATAATLNSPKDVAVDASGNIYIADESNRRIRKVAAATGIITTVAGNGNSIYVDGNQAVASSVTPTNVAVDSSGNIYLTDGGYIRKVTASTGVITTMAGGGVWGELGDNGPATSAWLYSPQGIALDSSGNLYIADTYNNRIRKVTAATGIISTVAGDGSGNYGGDGGQAPAAQLNYPIGVTVDSAGNLYIADWNNYRVRKVTKTTGVISTIAGNGSGGFSGDGGPAYNSGMYPDGVAVDPAGNLYISDVYNHRVRKVTAATGIISTIAGSGGFTGDGGTATGASFATPYDVARDSSGNIYIADYSNHRIRKVTAATGVITTVAGNGNAGFSGDFGPATEASMSGPVGVFVDAGGTMYIVDHNNCRIRKVDGTTGMITTVAGNGCGYGGDDGPATDAPLYYPTRVVVDGSGNLYIADRNSNRIRKVTAATGIITTVAGDGSAAFGGDTGPAISAQLNYVWGVALDASNNLYIADTNNHRIRKVTASTGVISTVAGSGAAGTFGDGGPASSAYLNTPQGIFLDVAGNLYIDDTGNQRVRRIDATTGVILTVAGTGTAGFSGDGGPAVQANLNNPTGVAVDNAGNIFIADSSNNRIREVVVNAIPLTSASPAGGSYSAPQNVTLIANKPVTTYYCLGSGCTPNTSSSVYSGPITISATTTLKFFSVDGAGNTESVKSAAYTITMTAPTTTATPPGGLYGLPQSVSLSCNDGSGPGCGPTYYCLGSGCTPTTVYSGPIAINTTQTLRYYSKDTANNSEAAKQANYTIYPGYPGSGTLPGTIGIISTYAGGGVGNNTPGTSAILNNPYSVARDNSGNIYVADTYNNMVRKLNATTGIITTVAGTGSASYSGDGGPATSATLNSPKGVAVDSSGNIYIADENNRRIRKVTAATGIITTVAGNGNNVYPGDGSQAVASSVNPISVAVDGSGNIYLTDGGYIRKVTAATGVITTVAGGGSELGDNGPATSASLYNPRGMSVDSSGNLYIADQYNHRIRKIAAANGIISTVAGDGNSSFGGDGGQATAAYLFYPIDVTVDGSGNLYIADQYNQRIRKVTKSSGIITTVAGDGNATFGGDTGQATLAQLQYPSGVTVDASGNLYIADQSNHRVRKVAAGVITTVAGNGGGSYAGDGGYANAAALASPAGMARDNSGNIFFADTNNHRVRKINVTTGIITTVAGNGSAGFSGDNGLASAAQFNSPQGVAVDGNGNLYIADYYNNRIRKVTASTGIITTVAGDGSAAFGGDDGDATAAQLYYPWSVAVDGSGNLYIADTNNHRIRKVNTTGIITTMAGDGTAAYGGDGGQASLAQINTPKGIYVDSSGNLYIADQNNNRIRKVAPGGVISTLAGTGTSGSFGDGGLATAANLSSPAAVTLDSNNNLYIADNGNNRVRRVDVASGIIITVAGDGGADYSGDGGPANLAGLNNPLGLVVDGYGDIFIADANNNRIREVTESLLSTITLNSGLNGHISGPTIVNYGTLPTYTFTPDSGCAVADVKINGVSVGAVSSYTYTSWITTDQTISATFIDIMKPTVTAFTIPANSNTKLVPINTFTASDNVGVTGYLVTSTSTVPLAGAAGWSGTKPANYNFSLDGSKTLYAWAKDAAGNVSAYLSATVNVDTTAPTVTAFTIPAVSNTKVVPITSFTASDAFGVTGYQLTETSTAPTAGGAGWSGTSPTSYTFATGGSKTLYAWAKDAVGNVSTYLSATVNVDITAPTVTAFTIPANSNTKVVPIASFTASDNAGGSGVTGYLLTETSTAPLAGAAGWSGTSPTSYTFATEGSKTLYAWAKDAAGNVSSYLSATVNVDLIAPTVTGFTIPTVSTTKVVPIITFTASDNAGGSGVSAYLVTASSTVPAAGAAGWSGTKPTSYTFSLEGSKTLYAWVKDAAGNISAYLSATVLVDTTPPTVTGFTIPAVSNTKVVPITTFTASDNAGGSGITGYLLTETSTAPLAGAAGWNGTSPTNYIFATEGNKTLYAWARDAVGNVSAYLSATVSVDTTPPTVTGFTIPATSNSTLVPFTTFTASDNVGVTGYLVTTTSTVPAAGAAGWSGTKPSSYNFSTEGSKTLYAWAKDAAGNVSSYLSATVTITLPVNGACGSSHNGVFITAPATNLCTSGTATTVSGTGPWSWSCTGTNGGTTANCSASIQMYPLAVTFAGTGGGSISGDVSCTSGTACTPGSFAANTQLTMIPLADSVSTFAGWSGACTNTSGNCTITMNSGKNVTATFTAAPKVKVGTKGFSTLQSAYNDAATTNGSVIKLLEGTLAENVICGRNISVIIDGGYNAAYDSVSTETTIDGTLKVRSGTVRPKKVKVKYTGQYISINNQPR